MSATANLPEKMTDQEARAVLEKNAERHQRISQEIMRGNARAEQGQQTLTTLLARAKEHFGTDNIDEIRKIYEERMANNARKVRDYLNSLSAVETSLDSLRKSVQPGR